MRSGAADTVQQTLTAEAASILKHSLNLARRRGHAQVTPLHVVTTLLLSNSSSSKASLLRKACLNHDQPNKSLSHPDLQCRALELCFNVALSRLETITPSHLFHSQLPSFSNALVAALKRAQAHQRRGYIEQQQQQQQTSVFTIKVELEQLVISILDDPSVSRVFKEAGLSSTLIKNKIEEFSSVNSSFFHLGNFWKNSNNFFTSNTYSSLEQNPVLLSSCGTELGLSLHANPSVHDSKPLSVKEEQDERLNCCGECTRNYEKDVQYYFKSGQLKNLPSWLQPFGSEFHYKDELIELRRKWNGLCNSLHQSKGLQNQLAPTFHSNQSLLTKPYSFTSSNPLWPTLNRSFQHSNSMSFTEKQISNHQTLDSLKNMEDKELNLTLSLGSSIFHDSRKLEVQKSENAMQQAYMCKVLREYVPWQSEIVSAIAEMLINFKLSKHEAWILIDGNDMVGKRRMACAIAELVFGDVDLLLNIRSRNTLTQNSELIEKALKIHEKLVVLVEDVELADAQMEKFLADGFESEKFGELSRKDGNLSQVIFVLTKDESRSYGDSMKDHESIVISMVLNVVKTVGSHVLDSYLKRKLKWESPKKEKHPRIDEAEGSKKYSSIITLDLNLKLDEEEVGEKSEEKHRELSPISSDLTLEATIDLQTKTGTFVDSIKNRFVFNRSPTRDEEISRLFMSKMKHSFEEVFGKKNLDSLRVEEELLEKLLLVGYGSFPNSLFDKWLKDILQTSLKTVGFGGNEGMEVRLCFGGNEDQTLEGGFMGSCLPKHIEVCFIE